MSADMEQHQSMSVASLWNVQGPYDINSILQSQCKDESSRQPPASTHSIRLVPPSLPANDDDNSPPCQLVLSCQPRFEVISIEVISNARHVELYDNLDSYCCTTRGTRQEEREGDQQTNAVLYAANLILDSPAHLCRLKFVSLTDKCQLTLSWLMVTYQKTEGESYHSGVGGRSINMVKVRQIMASLEQPIPSNVQSLMQTVEQYQKNQASVLDDFQQAATDRLLTSNDPKASLVSNMAGMLSAFSKASSFQQAAATVQAAAPTEAAESWTERELSAANSVGHSQGSAMVSQELNTESLSKLMASFGMQRVPVGREDVETNGCEASQDMLSALRTMCRDVSHMRAADRQAATRSFRPERQGGVEEHESNAEITRHRDKSSVSNGMVELEQRLMGYVAATEERIMGRLDQQMDLLRDHIDLRFDKLEALLQGRGVGVSENAARDGNLISEEVD